MIGFVREPYWPGVPRFFDVAVGDSAVKGQRRGLGRRTGLTLIIYIRLIDRAMIATMGCILLGVDGAAHGTRTGPHPIWRTRGQAASAV